MHCVYGGLPNDDGYIKTDTFNDVGARIVSCPCDVCRGDRTEGMECWYKEFVPKIIKSQLHIGQHVAKTAVEVMARMTSRVQRNVKEGVPLLVKVEDPAEFYANDNKFCNTAPCVAVAVAAGVPFKPKIDKYGRLPAIGGKAVSTNDTIVKIVWANFEKVVKGQRRTVAKAVYSEKPPHEERHLCASRILADCKQLGCKNHHYDFINLHSIIRADKTIQFHSEPNGKQSLCTTVLTDAEKKYNSYIPCISKL